MKDQLTLFEPSGSELASLAQGHYKKAETLGHIADTLEARGFTSSVKVFEFDSLREMRLAVVCETALQFESLAGLWRCQAAGLV